MKIASIGECMIELSPRPGGDLFALGFGGDTLNTAAYLARLGLSVDYVTALGTDLYSDKMMARWRTEGIGVGLVIRRHGRLPGLYMIEIDADGERRFHYWRDKSPARDLFNLPETDLIVDAITRYDFVYLSGISLSLYGEQGRAKLFSALDLARRNGAKVVFDTNYRPRGWSSPDYARQAVEAMMSRTDMMLTGAEDEQALFGDRDLDETLTRIKGRGIAEIVIKDGIRGCLIQVGKDRISVPVGGDGAVTVVDTTAAGDSFNAAYLAARIKGLLPYKAAEAGHRLAAAVVQHYGAIIPLESMPEVIFDEN